MTASGHLNGRHWAVFRGRQQWPIIVDRTIVEATVAVIVRPVSDTASTAGSFGSS
jgi:hypothetical protein